MNDFTRQLKRFFGKLSIGQRVALGAVVVGTLATLIGVAYWANQPSYSLLFGNLDSSNANSIVETLREDDIPYKLSDGGKAVHVPQDKVYELRMRFASEGVVSNGPAGYDLFDKNTLGMTDFMQKLNKKRALEGELATTISGLHQVAQARVHLVTPERKPFQSQQTKPTASVVISFAGSRTLEAAQVSGITSLVAGSVQGMSPSDVTILDSEGNMLSDPGAGDDAAQLTSTQMEMQRKVERDLIESGQTMLDRVLGEGNSILRLTANLNFDRKVTEAQTIDPESRTVISEERLQEQDAAAGQANSEVRNYEVSRTQTRVEESIGEVQRLTVSVVLDQKTTEPAEEGAAPTPVPYTQQQMTRVENMIKSAVGFDQQRGDQFSLQQVDFTTSSEDRLVAQMQREERNRQVEKYIRYLLIALALGLVVWLIRSTANQIEALDENGPLSFSQNQGQRHLAGDGQPAIQGSPRERAVLEEGDDFSEEEVLEPDIYTSKLTEEARRRLQARHKLFSEVKGKVDSDPAHAASLLRSWIVGNEAGNDDEKERATV